MPPARYSSGQSSSKKQLPTLLTFSLRVIIAYLLIVVTALYIHPHLTAGKSNSSPTSSPAAPAIVKEAPDRFPDAGWRYDFSEMPDGPLPSGDWNFEDGVEVANYNNEAQAYTSRPQNVRVEDGSLVIQAHREDLHGKNYTSARINTFGTFDFTYGTLEVEMMLPPGKGTWPAAWLMPSKNIYKPEDYGIRPNDPQAWVLNGEIDFMEAIGSIPGENIPAAHSYNQRKSDVVYTPGNVATPYTQYHRYGIIKSPNKIEFTIDGQVFTTREKTSDSPLDWPFEQPYYLILNLALGGDWAGVEGIDDSMAPWAMKIKSISYAPLQK